MSHFYRDLTDERNAYLIEKRGSDPRVAGTWGAASLKWFNKSPFAKLTTYRNMLTAIWDNRPWYIKPRGLSWNARILKAARYG